MRGDERLEAGWSKVCVQMGQERFLVESRYFMRARNIYEMRLLLSRSYHVPFM